MITGKVEVSRERFDFHLTVDGPEWASLYGVVGRIVLSRFTPTPITP